ncbi:MAG: class I SAM-dependent methyltransferase [Candidatus Promineifilaceae bacterium]|nr:class I SAM-dependent methyltransferase [Candidatus Promineifilaceae bacterium]
MKSLRGVATQQPIDLKYFVEWRTSLWGPAVRWLLDDPSRFMDKRVLEVGCRSGRISCLFGLLGAHVTGVDLHGVDLTAARAEAERWGLAARVRFANYSGKPADLPGGEYDFVFAKSVLVIVPELESFLEGLARKMQPEGELLLAENAGSETLYFLRWLYRVVAHRCTRSFRSRFSWVDEQFLAALSANFDLLESKQFYRLVVALRARPLPRQ